MKYKRWGQIKLVFLPLVKRMDVGTNPRGVVGGFSSGGLNVNNNNDDNENIGVGVLRKFCDFPR
jgi:hypothetical protein